MTMQESASSKSLDGLLGMPGLPQWLDPDKLLADSFSSELAVAELRRYVPLPTLQSELENYLASLKTKMVEVINADYSDYVSLSSKLVNVDGAVVRMRKPLVDLREKLQALQGSVVGELTSLNQGLRRRKEVATARSLLDLMQQLAHIASKVEKLLAEVDALPPLGPGQAEGEEGQVELGVRARLLERVAGEVSRLSFQAKRGKDLAFVRAMEPRISASRAHILAHLAPAMQAALSASMAISGGGGSGNQFKGGPAAGDSSHAAVLHCVHAYAELGDAPPAEAAVRTIVIAPIVAQHLAAHKAHAGPARGSAPAAGEGTLAHLFDGILEDVLTHAGPLLSASLTPQSPLRSFDFLGNALLAEVDEAVAAALPGAFSPGVPPAFHANFLAAQRFLEALEAQCRSRAALERLRASPHCASFLRRWNTSVYFSLIYQDVAGELEDAVAIALPDLKAPPAGPAAVHLPASVALVACLGRAAAPHVFLPQLADRFLRLALQLGQRYRAWVTTVGAARKAKGQPPPYASPAPATPGTHPTSSPGPKQAPGASEKPGAPSLPPGAAWVAPLAIEEVVAVQQDMEAAGAYLAGPFADAFVRLLPRGTSGAGQPTSTDVPEAARVALQQLGETIQAQAAELLGAACGEVVESCVSLLKQLKGITATYRMTSKGPPTRHSHYVTGVLGPLRAVLGNQVSGPVANRLAAAAVDAVTVRYKELAVELLTTVRKTESSLKRLKKARPGEAEGSESGMSDSDKITLQLYLDVQEYGVQAAKFDLQPQLLPSFQALLEAVTPTPAVLQAAGMSAPAGGSSSGGTRSVAPAAAAAPVAGLAPDPSPPQPTPQAPQTTQPSFAPPPAPPPQPTAATPQGPFSAATAQPFPHPEPSAPPPPPPPQGLAAAYLPPTASLHPSSLGPPPAHSAIAGGIAPYPFPASSPHRPPQFSAPGAPLPSSYAGPPQGLPLAGTPPGTPQQQPVGEGGTGMGDGSGLGAESGQQAGEAIRGLGGLRKQDAFACYTR